jgi:hypothetical protein
MAYSAISQIIGRSMSNMSLFPSYSGFYLLFDKNLSHLAKVNPVISHFQMLQVFIFWPLFVGFVIDIENNADEIRKWLKLPLLIHIFPYEAQCFHVADRRVTHQLLHRLSLDNHSFVDCIFLVSFLIDNNPI